MLHPSAKRYFSSQWGLQRQLAPLKCCWDLRVACGSADAEHAAASFGCQQNTPDASDVTSCSVHVTGEKDSTLLQLVTSPASALSLSLTAARHTSPGPGLSSALGGHTTPAPSQAEDSGSELSASPEQASAHPAWSRHSIGLTGRLPLVALPAKQGSLLHAILPLLLDCVYTVSSLLSDCFGTSRLGQQLLWACAFEGVNATVSLL